MLRHKDEPDAVECSVLSPADPRVSLKTWLTPPVRAQCAWKGRPCRLTREEAAVIGQAFVRRWIVMIQNVAAKTGGGTPESGKGSGRESFDPGAVIDDSGSEEEGDRGRDEDGERRTRGKEEKKRRKKEEKEKRQEEERRAEDRRREEEAAKDPVVKAIQDCKYGKYREVLLPALCLRASARLLLGSLCRPHHRV